MELNKVINRTVGTKVEKQNTPKFDEFIMKVDVKCFGCKNIFFRTLNFMENVVKIAKDVRWNNRRKESVYKNKDSSQYIQHIFENTLRYCHVDWCLKFVWFLRDITEDDKTNYRNYCLKKNGGKEEKINMNVVFIRINLNLLYGAQGSIDM